MFFTKKFNLFALAVFVLVTLAGMWVPLVINAAKYAQISREIIDSGNWIELTIVGDAYNQKPPLLFWLGAISFSIFGVSTFAFKLPVILYSLGGIVAIYKLSNILYDKTAAKFAAFFWATSLGYLFFHNDIHTDTLLATNVIIAIWLITDSFTNNRRYNFYLGAFFTGLAMLSKGPVGLAVPAMAVGSQLLIHQKWKEIFHYRWILALIIVVLTISPALLGLYRQFGMEGLKFYFWTNNVGRITGSYQGGNTDIFFYFHNSLYILVPWTFFAFAGIGLEIKSKIIQLKNKVLLKQNSEFISLGGIFPYLVVLSLAKQKNPHYLLAIVPLILMLAAKWVIPIFEDPKYKLSRKILSVLNYLLAAVLWFAFLSILLVYYPENKTSIWVLIILSAIACLAFLVVAKGLKKQVPLLLTSSALLLVLIYTSIFPKMMQYHSPHIVAETFNQQADDNDQLYSFRVRYWGVFFYSKNYGTWIKKQEELSKLTDPENAWVYTDAYGVDILKEKGYDFDVIETVLHKSITGQSLKFLTSKDRKSRCSEYYLLKLN